MADPNETITVENVVATTAIGQELDLEKLDDDLPETDYDPDRFPGLVFRTQDPKATTLIFRSGNVVTTGAKRESAISAALDIMFEDFADLGIPVLDAPEITTRNIASSGDLDQPLNLNAIAIGLAFENIEYEPEQFPGLVYRLDEPSVVALLFNSGKLVIAGGKTTDDAAQAIDAVRARLSDLDLLR